MDGSNIDGIMGLLNQRPPISVDFFSREILTEKPIFSNKEFSWADNIKINQAHLDQLEHHFMSFDFNQIKNRKTLLLKIIEFIDLTTLSGDDTAQVVRVLTLKAIQPLSRWLEAKVQSSVHTAAVCVYPARVQNVIEVLNEEDARRKVKVASVAAGFPSGQYLLETRLLEIELLAQQHVDEVDIVIQRSLVLSKQWKELHSEISQMKAKCTPPIVMKTILSVGELKTSENICAASLIAIMAGSDFIKTSTGKEKVNATIRAGIVMCSAIKNSHHIFMIDRQIGIKPAGGISTFEDCVRWMYMVGSLLGPKWLTRDYFRIGASGLLDNLIRELEQCE
uniref:deoxyribose-phosphate aldolase n=1 Tax=Cacopsylla melanoneura TaxID=428564 RepID=A0A8D8XH40_9HEMI